MLFSLNLKNNLTKGSAGSDGNIGARCSLDAFNIHSDIEIFWTQAMNIIHGLSKPVQFVRGCGVTVTHLVLDPSSL